MRIRALTQQKADLIAEGKRIRQAAETDKRRFTADEKTRLGAIETDLTALDEDIALEQRQQERERSLQPVVDPDQAIVAAAEARAGIVPTRVQVGASLAEQDPNKGFRSPKDFIGAVMVAGLSNGRRVDARLEPLKVHAAAGGDEARSDDGQYGAFLVPAGFSPTLLELTPEDDPTASETTKMPMANPTVAIPARVDKDHSTSVSGGLIVTRRPQTASATSSRMKLDGVTFRANSLFGLAFATEEILMDSPISFAAILARGFQQEFAAHALTERLSGTGVGEPLGILNAPCLVSVSKETGQAAKTIVKENIDKMRARTYRYSRAIWLANHDTLPQLASLVQIVGVGGTPVPYFTVSADGTQFLLAGRPIYFTEFAETVGTKGDLILGNWSEYIDALYQPLESAESIHVRFVEHERTLKFWLRNDGQPWWKSALTPRKSADTLSPFVVLATRA
jgi:HK97 family phage major capsid protein